MMRLAWLTPLSPATGISKYSLAAVDALRVAHHVDIWAEPSDSDVLRGSEFHRLADDDATLSALDDYDLVVFNIGNNIAFHEVAFSLSQQHQGLVILHDKVLQDLVFPFYVERRRDYARYLALMAHYYGRAGLDYALRRTRGMASDAGTAAYPLFECALQTAAGVLAHSGEALELFDLYPGLVPVGRANHLFYLYAKGLADGIGTERHPGPIRIVTHGNIVPSKRVESLLTAYADSPSLREKSELVIVGGASAAYGDSLRRKARDLGLSTGVTFTGRVDDQTMHRHLREADVFVNLRHPSTEVASGALVEQFRFGKPLVVSRTGFYAELPDDVAFKVDTTDEVPQVRMALETLIAKPALRAEMGEAASRYGRVRFSPEAYREAFEDLARRTLEALPLVKAVDARATSIARQPHGSWHEEIAAAAKEMAEQEGTGGNL